MQHPPDVRGLYGSDDGYRRAMSFYDELLTDCVVPYTTEYVTSSLGPIHVLSAGDPALPPLILLHGQGASAPSLVGQINGLSRYYRLHAVDVPHSTGKSTPTPVPRKGTAGGVWLAETLDGLDITSAHFAGISHGAWLIFKLAAVAPSVIRSAVLMSAAGLIPVARSLKWAIALLAPRLVWQTPADRAAAVSRLLGIPNREPSWQDTGMFEVLLGDFKREAPPPVLADADLRCLTAPTLLLMGQYDAAYPAPEAITRARAALPNLKDAQIVPGVSHGMVTDDPEAVNERIHAFVRRYR